MLKPLILAALAAGPAALAQSTVLILENRFDQAQLDPFYDWVNAFRADMETMIDEGRMSKVEACAYRRWRIMGPKIEPSGEALVYFMFDPVLEGARYGLAEFLIDAVGAEAAMARMVEWEAMGIDQTVFLNVPIGYGAEVPTC